MVKIGKLWALWVMVGCSVASYAQQPAVQFLQLDVNKGLSSNQVTAIVKDQQGFLWFGTAAGLNRYDGREVTIFRHNSRDSSSLSDNSINNLFVGPYGQIWVGNRAGFDVFDAQTEKFDHSISRQLKVQTSLVGVTAVQRDVAGRYWILDQDSGLFRFDTARRVLQPYKTVGHNRHISGISTGKDNDLWLVYDNGFIEQIRTDNFKPLFSTQALVNRQDLDAAAGLQLYMDREKGLWVYARNQPAGAYYFPPGYTQFHHLHTDAQVGRLNSNLVSGVTEDNRGRIWLATDHGGINIVEKKKLNVSYLLNEEFDERSLAQNSTVNLYKDRDGIIWVGTYKKGVSYYHENLVKFPVYRHKAGNQVSLPYDDVNRFAEDREGNLWIGTNGGGLAYYNRAKHAFKLYRHQSTDPHSISSDVIVSLCFDKQGILWIGTYHGGLEKFDGKQFTHYLHDPANPESIPDNSVWELMEDSRGRLWVGTLSGGLCIFDREKNRFERLGYGSTNGSRSSYISALMEDNQGRIWIGSATGIDVMDARTGHFRHIQNDPKQPHSLSNDYINDIQQDSRNRIWIGTRDGLNLYNEATGDFKIFRQEDGLTDNTVLTMLEDGSKKLWLSTLKGISAMRYPAGEEGKAVFLNYDSSDGLQATAFNENAALRTSRGELIFGGPSGFNLIDPHTLKEPINKPIPIITNILLFNKPVRIGEKVDGHVLLEHSPALLREISLAHDQYMFSIAFTSLDFLNKEHSGFLYKLEGFNENWVQADRNHPIATFTNLDAGDYTFKVRVSANSGPWSDAYELLRIHISPPFWRTPWAYLLYAVLVVGTLLLVRHIEKQRAVNLYKLRQEREEAQRIRELDSLKTRFFTNVSHEFRTPLSLILSPLDKLITHAADEQQRTHLSLIQRNARRLLNLVNQLLDFRKMDQQELRLHPQPGDIIQNISQHVDSFSDMAEKKQIQYTYEKNITQWYTSFDHDKLERVLFNLLSNAFKFTPEGGKVGVRLNLKKDDEQAEACLYIQVSDSGIGIPADKQEQVFKRYFQHDTPPGLLNQGSGIGLSITREYVLLAGGDIRLESIPDQGSIFTVMLPLHPVTDPPGKNTDTQPRARKADHGVHARQRILLVEDNDDFRFYLKDNLREFYLIEEATEATAGWQKTLAIHPDLIVSDISMPGSSGIEFCRKLKNDPRTAHIPVILLTAITDEQTQLEGLETGAADYITKPFNVELLLSKIKTQLRQKSSLEKTYKKQLSVQPHAAVIPDADEKFMRMALEVTERFLGDANFSVEQFAREMGMSRVGLYKKMLLLSGHTPSEFMRNIRMKRAAQLLEQSQLSIAEVAYEVGFNSPKQFSKYFKSVYLVLPSAYRK
ncbi:Signal transduction histidine kinase [bacterium A37T11]|nr:Signal transduction histidine kinase [bacterium A37T11]